MLNITNRVTEQLAAHVTLMEAEFRKDQSMENVINCEKAREALNIALKSLRMKYAKFA